MATEGGGQAELLESSIPDGVVVDEEGDYSEFGNGRVYVDGEGSLELTEKIVSYRLQRLADDIPETVGEFERSDPTFCAEHGTGVTWTYSVEGYDHTVTLFAQGPYLRSWAVSHDIDYPWSPTDTPGSGTCHATVEYGFETPGPALECAIEYMETFDVDEHRSNRGAEVSN